MQIDGRCRVLTAVLCASLWLVAQTAAAQSKTAAPQIKVYESPT